MNINGMAAVRLMLCTAIAFASGVWWMSARRQSAAPHPPRVLYYHDPMHPSFKSDQPGIAPDCGMQLEPVYADAGFDASPVQPGRSGTVRISAQKQQLIGVRVEEVRRAEFEDKVRILGRVVADDSRLYRVIAPGDGQVYDLSTATAGTLVKKDQTLASIFSRDSVSLRDALAFLSQVRPAVPPATPVPNPESNALYLEYSRDSLRLLGMEDRQIQELERTRHATSRIHISSPVSGLILTRNLSPGQRFDKGAELYRIADLSTVWVVADVFERDARLVGSATRATVRYQDREIPSRVSTSVPQFDANTRTLKVRLEVANPHLVLRPDMFVDVLFDVTMHSAITAPVDAILESGLRKTVFVDLGDGSFEPRTVETGARLGDRVVITAGLEPGERIVVSGNFLIDSESRLQAAALDRAAYPVPAQKAVASATDPVCGMNLETAKLGQNQAEYNGKVYYFCSDSCKRKFVTRPEQYSSPDRLSRVAEGPYRATARLK